MSTVSCTIGRAAPFGPYRGHLAAFFLSLGLAACGGGVPAEAAQEPGGAEGNGLSAVAGGEVEQETSGGDPPTVEPEAEPTTPCVDFPGATVVRLDDIEVPGNGDEWWVRVTPASEPAVGLMGLRVDFHGRLQRAPRGAIEVVFAAAAESGTEQEVDCVSPGTCRRALYARCLDDAYAELIPPGQYGSFRPKTRAGEALAETRTDGQTTVDVDWQWRETCFEPQGESPVTLPTPQLSESERPVGMPAVSRDGRRVATLYSWGTELEGMGQNFLDLRLHRTSDGRVVQTIRLYGEDEDGEPALSEAATRRAYQAANALLNRGRYRAMTALANLSGVERPLRDASAVGIRLVDDGRGTIQLTGLVEVEHTPRGVSTSAYCCGLDDGDADQPDACELLPDVERAWANAEARVVLVSLVSQSQTSGCEGEGESTIWMHRGTVSR